MNWPPFFNLIIIILGLGIIWRIWKSYRLISSPAFILLILAFGFLTAYRVMLPKFPQISGYGVALPFYILALAAFDWLFRSLDKEICGPKEGKGQYAYQRKRPSWLTTGNILVSGFILAVAIVLICLDLLERY